MSTEAVQRSHVSSLSSSYSFHSIWSGYSMIVFLIVTWYLSIYSIFLYLYSVYIQTCSSFPYHFLLFEYSRTVSGNSVSYYLGNFLITGDIPIVCVYMPYFLHYLVSIWFLLSASRPYASLFVHFYRRSRYVYSIWIADWGGIWSLYDVAIDLCI